MFNGLCDWYSILSIVKYLIPVFKNYISYFYLLKFFLDVPKGECGLRTKSEWNHYFKNLSWNRYYCNVWVEIWVWFGWNSWINSILRGHIFRSRDNSCMYLIYRHTPVYRYKYFYNLYTDIPPYTGINTPVNFCILLYTDIFLYTDISTPVYSRIQT